VAAVVAVGGGGAVGCAEQAKIAPPARRRGGNRLREWRQHGGGKDANTDHRRISLRRWERAGREGREGEEAPRSRRDANAMGIGRPVASDMATAASAHWPVPATPPHRRSPTQVEAVRLGQESQPRSDEALAGGLLIRQDVAEDHGASRVSTTPKTPQPPGLPWQAQRPPSPPRRPPPR